MALTRVVLYLRRIRRASARTGMVRLIIVILVAASTACATAVEKTAIRPSGFPDGRPFEPGLLVGGTLYVSGMLGSELSTGQFPEVFESEVKVCLDKIGLVLRAAGMDFSDILDGIANIAFHYFKPKRKIKKRLRLSFDSGKNQGKD